MTIYKDAVGKVLRVDIGQSLAGATTMRIDITKPSGTLMQKTATQYGSTEKITYTTVAGDLDEVGTYSLNSYVEWGTASKEPGDTYHFEVEERGNVSQSEVIDGLKSYTFIESVQSADEEEDGTNTTADVLYPQFSTYFKRAKNELGKDTTLRGITLDSEDEIAAISYLIASYIIERNPAWAASSVSQPGGGSVSRSIDSKTGMNISDPERSYNKLLDKIEAGTLTNEPLIDVSSEMIVHDDETDFQGVREGSYDPLAE